MKLIVGLGNPGKRYQKTRHNAGFRVVDLLSRGEPWQESKKGKLLFLWLSTDEEKIELVKPTGYVNNSGDSLSYVYKKHPELSIDNLYVAYDDLDIRLGDYKIQKGKGPKDHNGINSIYQKLGKKDFWHVRVGVDNRDEKNRISGEDYVLGPFSQEEERKLNEGLKGAVEDLKERLGIIN